MKIGILTYHRAINYGAFLQAYSLMNHLQKKFRNVEIEIIDYVPLWQIKIYFRVFIYSLLKGRWKKIKQFFLFWKSQKIMKLSKRVLWGSKKRIQNEICNLKYNIIIVGSDEVWNGTDDNFWLCDVKGSKKVSYAASSRKMISKLSDSKREYIHRALEQFIFIGVRDKVTKAEIEKVLKKEVSMNCDPAFLYDIKFDKEKYKRNIYRKYNISSKCKLIGIMFDKNDEICEKVKEIYRGEAVLISLYTEHKIADINAVDLSPFEWVKIIGCLDCLVTSYFHGVVYAIKSHIKFIAIDYSPIQNSKIYDLLDRESLLDYYINGCKLQLKKQCEKIEKIITLNKDLREKYCNIICNQRKLFVEFEKEIVHLLEEE